MITQQDQLSLFQLISNKITEDITCYAFGGTAMMFYGYKGETKDVDILFEEESERKEFIHAIGLLGYRETSLLTIYIPEKARDPHRPLMFKQNESRFDLFVKKIFQTQLSPKMKEDIYSVHEFKDKKVFTVKVLRTEIIVLLKSVTERDKDFEDIITILQKNKNFDWEYFTDEALWQFQHGDGWVLLDVEKMMKELKRYVFIEEKWFKKLYTRGIENKNH